MITVHKFLLQITPQQVIKAPATFTPIRAALDPKDQPAIWALVDTDRSEREFTVFIVGTGHPIPSDVHAHIGSFNQGEFVWHVFLK